MADRRNFLKNGILSSIGLWVLPGTYFAENSTDSFSDVDELEEGFRNPPPSAKPLAYWMWMNGHITRQGITLDLERMKEMGLAGAFIYNTGTGIPKGPVVYGSTTWNALLKHAMQEAQRLGLQLCMHNSPGFSSTGGAKVLPEQSMQQLVWTETIVQGERSINVLLTQPYTKHGYYRDAFVVAFPSLPAERAAMIDSLLRVMVNGKEIDKHLLHSKTPEGSLALETINGKPAVLQLEFSEPFTASAITITRQAQFSQAAFDAAYNRPFVFVLEKSDDGFVYQNVCTIAMPRQRNMDAPGAQNFPSVKAKLFRLTSAQPTRIIHFELHGTPRLQGWPGKAGFTDAETTENHQTVKEEAIIQPSSIINITDKLQSDGRLIWQPPAAGRWTILRIGYTCAGAQTVSSPDGATGLEIDKFSKEAVDDYFTLYLNEILNELKPFIPQTFKGLFIDSWEVGRQNWTKNFPEEFGQRCGYNITSFLPALTGRIVQSVEATEKFLHDVRQTQAGLVAHNYYGQFKKRCHQAGLQLFAQPNGDGAFDSLQCGGQVDEALAEFWARYLPGTINLCKQAVSIAHGYGKKIVAAEAYTGLPELSRWTEYPYALKSQGDYMFSMGINRFVFHVFVHQPYTTGQPGMTMGPYGLHFDRNLTWGKSAKPWMQYLNRTQYLLQQGLPVVDVCYFKGEEPASGIPDVHYVNPPVPKTLAGDVIGRDVLMTRIEVKDGNILLPDGMSYRLMILAPLKRLSLEIISRLKQLVEGGMALIVTVKPDDTPGLKSSAETKTLIEELWGDVDGIEKRERTIGKGKLYWNKPFAEILQAHNIQPDFEFTAKNADAAIHFTHRRFGDAEIYFVSNHLRRDEEVVCSFRVNEKTPEIWNPQTGERSFAALYSFEEGRTIVPLVFGPADAMFIIFRKKTAEQPYDELLQNGKVVLTTKPYPASVANPHQHIVNNFTIAIWVKPDAPSFHPKGSVVFPPEGEAVYGTGHAACGLAAGQNGVRVYERDKGPNHAARLVLHYTKSLEGWTHLALRYKEGIPSLFINGMLVSEGKASGKIVHPGLHTPPTDETFSALFEGGQTTPELITEALPNEAISSQYQKGLPAPELPFAIELSRQANGLLRALTWQNGLYELKSKQQTKRIEIKGCKVIPIETAWTVLFPSNSPASIKLSKLISLHKHPQFDVRHFSGTAVWKTRFQFSTINRSAEQKVLLHLGRIEVVAGVKLNGKSLGTLWKEPFAVDITRSIKAGENSLELSVTNLWPNRMIGDEYFPKEATYDGDNIVTAFPDWYVNNKPKPGPRKTFAAFNNFQKTNPLLESGLLGPVRLIIGVEKTIS